MQRQNRLFEIIQILRAEARPVTADKLAERLEVSKRTIYRDILALQAMQTPIEGAAGIGYMMRRGYDLPPLNFSEEEVEALRVGLSMLARSGDSSLQRAASRITEKIEALQTPADWLQVSPWGAAVDDPEKGCVSMSLLRQAIRREEKLQIRYLSGTGTETTRIIRPIAMVYHLECVMVGGWCELRDGFRHFRTDRIYACELTGEGFAGQSAALRALWLEKNRWDKVAG